MRKFKRLTKALLYSLLKVIIIGLISLIIGGAIYLAIHHHLAFVIGLLIIFIGILTWIKYEELD